MNLIQNLESNKIILNQVIKPIASYVSAIRCENLIYVSGQLPIDDKGELCLRGPIDDSKIEVAKKAAAFCFINALAAVQSIIPLNEIKQLVQIQGFVQSKNDFYNQALVINGASDLAIKLMGDAGRHSRFAVGVNSLPLNASVEISFIFAC